MRILTLIDDVLSLIAALQLPNEPAFYAHLALRLDNPHVPNPEDQSACARQEA
jgi:hypothetical protein